MTAPTLTIQTDVIIEDENWTAIEPKMLSERCANVIEEFAPAKGRSGDVALLFTSNEAVHHLNRDWRDKDKPTNVLSFPADPIPGLPDDARPLGDLALAYGVCTEEAAAKNISPQDHATHLVIHGLLHLFGYDHIEQSEAEEMEQLETQLLAHLGIADPYRDL